MTYEIRDDVPIPTRPFIAKYPFAEMEIGQSFFVPGATTKKLAGSLYYAHRALGYKFVTRTVVENDLPGVRVWRLS